MLPTSINQSINQLIQSIDLILSQRLSGESDVIITSVISIKTTVILLVTQTRLVFRGTNDVTRLVST